jgi:protein-tyrosine phosphatase
MKIQNISLSDVIAGNHYNTGNNTILIQIVDPDCDFPIPKQSFKQVHRFKFLDIEERDQLIVGRESWRCDQTQADELVQILKDALYNNLNVIVHCHAGVCRSGAVCEVGVMMGFEDLNSFRIPNLLVKTLMMKNLGWTYE